MYDSSASTDPGRGTSGFHFVPGRRGHAWRSHSLRRGLPLFFSILVCKQIASSYVVGLVLLERKLNVETA